MANTITKYQVQYLKDRLDTIKREKIESFKQDKGLEKPDKTLALYDAIKAGVIKMKPRKDVAKDSYYCYSRVDELFDLTKFDEAYKKAEDSFSKATNDYENKLEAAITDILDSVVLRGLDIQEAVAKFEKM